MFQPVTKAETKTIVSTETLIDVEREIAEQIRRIQRYFYKLNNNLGTVETATKNLKDAFRIIDELLQEGSIGSDKSEQLEEYRQRFLQITTP